MLCNVKGGSFTIAKVNEDTYGWASDCAWVLDGSTGLNGKRLVADENGSDAQWYAREFSRFLKRTLPNSEQSLEELFSEGVRTVWSKFVKRAHGDVAREDVPCTLGTAVRIREDYLEYINVGDCCLLVRLRDNRVVELLDDTLCTLDGNTLRQGQEISQKEGIPLSQCREKMLPELRRVRMTMNTPEGYISLADDPLVVKKAKTGKIPLKEVLDFCIVSDGFREYYQMFNLAPSVGVFIDRVAQMQPEVLFAQLVSAQQSDPEFTNYPRFKMSDDATVFYAKVGE